MLGFPMMSGESRLPELAIARIQSFLSSKEAARTALLSKSWGGAWLTRPNLDFEDGDFVGTAPPCVYDYFLDFVSKALKRYEDSNVTIESLGLRMENRWCYYPHAIAHLAVRALKLGATRLAFDINSSVFDLPNDVFASENLVQLTVKGMKIDLGPNTKEQCSKLRSLSLENVKIENPNGLCYIFSMCPLIEELLLSRILMYGGVGDVRINLHRLRSLVLNDAAFIYLFLSDLSPKFPSLEDLALYMWAVKIEEDDDLYVFLSELSSKFPSLKHFALYMWNRDIQEDMLISSLSLERMDFNITGLNNNRRQRVKFDVPNIRKLTFKSTACLPPVIRPNLMGWEFDDHVVSAMHHHPKCLSASKIDFLGDTFLRGVGVRISALSQLRYDGLNDLKEARAQIFDEDASMWRDVALVDDSTTTTTARDVRFQLVWEPKQKLIN